MCFSVIFVHMSRARINRRTTKRNNTSNLNLILTGGLVVLCTFGLWGQRWSEIPEQYTVDDGLPTLDCYHLYQDEAGFLWIGTDIGVTRFDGYDFESLTMRDGLSNNDVIRIREDQQGRIWLNSIGPPSIIENGEVRILNLPELDTLKLGFDFLESAESGFWFNYSSSFHYVGPDQTIRPTPKALLGPTPGSSRSMEKLEDGKILVYNGRKIYTTWNDDVVDSLSLPAEMQMVPYLCYTYTPDGVYFVNTEGLQYWSFQTDKVQMLDSAIKIGLDLKLEGDQLFLLHPNYGLRIYDFQPEGVRLSQQFFPSNFCNSYLLDHEGNLWITSLGNGLFFYPQQNVESNAMILPKEHQRINKLHVYEDNILLGTFNGRIYSYDPVDRTTSLWIESSAPENDIFDRVMDIVQLRDGTLLVGKDTGLYELEKDSLRYLANLAIKNLHIDQSDGLIINTQRACYYVGKDLIQQWVNSSFATRKVRLATANVLSDSRGYSSVQARDGTIWVDNTRKGLLSMRDGLTTEWKDRSNIFGVHINDMIELPDSTLALATHGEGLILIKNGDYWVLNEIEQLPSSIVNALYIHDNTLWVATNRGIASLQDISVPRRQFTIDVYNRNDGLVTEDIADLVIWNDQLMLASQLGLITMPIKQTPNEDARPRISLKRVESGGYQLNLQESEQLAHNQNSLQFHFLGISFRSKGKLRYRYRLRGYDQDWASTINREVTYHNLSPGEYTFEVSAIDYKGHVSEQPASISFEIKPHFTQRSIFWVIIGALGIFLLAGGVRVYLSIRERNVLSKLVDEKTAKLDHQLRQLARSNEELEQFARAASHDLKSPLRNVASFVQLLDRRANKRLDSEEREFIDLAIQGVKGMERTIDDLLKVSRIDQDNEDKEVLNFWEVIEEIKQANQLLFEEQNAEVIIETPLPDLLFSKVNAYQLLQNLIVNAITYRAEDDPVIRIACEEHDNGWVFSVKDNGMGIAPEFQKQIFEIFNRLHHSKDIPGTGIGLAICKKIVERNGGTMSVYSEAGHGATFFFSIPKQ